MSVIQRDSLNCRLISATTHIFPSMLAWPEEQIIWYTPEWLEDYWPHWAIRSHRPTPCLQLECLPFMDQLRQRCLNLSFLRLQDMEMWPHWSLPHVTSRLSSENEGFFSRQERQLLRAGVGGAPVEVSTVWGKAQSATGTHGPQQLCHVCSPSRGHGGSERWSTVPKFLGARLVQCLSGPVFQPETCCRGWFVETDLKPMSDSDQGRRTNCICAWTG